VTERNVDTSVELQAGQSLALAGLIQNRVEASNRGIPGLADVPVLGRFFSRVEEKTNEVELLMIVTPELIAPLNPHEVPLCGPGQLTTSPSDKELYAYGYLEVPHCGPCLSVGPCGVLGGEPELPPVEMMPLESAMVPNPAFLRRTEHAPTIRDMPNNAVMQGGSHAVPHPGAPPPIPAEARRPVLSGPIGYDPLP
jgi:pilus assembly protein CpaC